MPPRPPTAAAFLASSLFLLTRPAPRPSAVANAPRHAPPALVPLDRFPPPLLPIPGPIPVLLLGIFAALPRRDDPHPAETLPNHPRPPQDAMKRHYSALRPFVIISLSYLLFTTTDGAIRMIVLLHAYKSGFSAWQVRMKLRGFQPSGHIFAGTRIAA